jgi:hypothetical protein
MKYPNVLERPCEYCAGEIVIKNSSFDKPNRRFCSGSCRTSWLNKTRPVTETQRNKSSERLKKLWENGVMERIIKGPEMAKIRSKNNLGEKSHFWKGGLTDENRKLRNSYLARNWRKAVFERDDYTCQECGARNGNGKTVHLNADHKKPWFSHPELRFEISNGRTLCLECHTKTDTFGIKAVIGQKNYLGE